MAGLTQEQADLLYSAIAHLHDDRYSLLGHLHDDRYSELDHVHDGRYSQLGHLHTTRVPLLFHGQGATIPAGATYYFIPAVPGIQAALGATFIPFAATLRNLYFRLNSAQPASGSLVVTVQSNLVNTALTVTIPAGSAGAYFSDLTHSVNLSGGELLCIAVKNNATSASGSITSSALELQPTTS